MERESEEDTDRGGGSNEDKTGQRRGFGLACDPVRRLSGKAPAHAGDDGGQFRLQAV